MATGYQAIHKFPVVWAVAGLTMLTLALPLTPPTIKQPLLSQILVF